MAIFRVSMVGHSHVKHFHRYTRKYGHIHDKIHNCIDFDRLHLSFLGASGLKMKHLFARLPNNLSAEKQMFVLRFREILRSRPNAILLWMGDNDVSCHSVEELAFRIISVATLLQRSFHVPHIILGQILPRYGVGVEEYNSKAKQVNEIVAAEVKRHEGLFFQHHGFQFPGDKRRRRKKFCSYASANKFFQDDGVHLNKKGNLRLLKRVINTIIQEATHN